MSATRGGRHDMRRLLKATRCNHDPPGRQPRLATSPGMKAIRQHGPLPQSPPMNPTSGCLLHAENATPLCHPTGRRFNHYQCCSLTTKKKKKSVTSESAHLFVVFFPSLPCLSWRIRVCTLADPGPSMTPSCFPSHAGSHAMKG